MSFASIRCTKSNLEEDSVHAACTPALILAEAVSEDHTLSGLLNAGEENAVVGIKVPGSTPVTCRASAGRRLGRL
jgi:hypothetical protein